MRIKGSKQAVQLLLAVLLGTACGTLNGQARLAPVDAVRAGFKTPPAAARLRCYWWWLNGNTTAATITHDLEEMKAHGYGGAILVDADGSGQQGNLEVRTGPAIGTPEWMALFLHALEVARRLDLEISLNVTSRWDVGIIGGATVTPEDALKLLTWSRAAVEGGGTRKLDLALPPARNGVYHAIAVLAYPLHHGSPLPGSAGSNRTAIRNLTAKAAWAETGSSMPSSDRILREEAATPGEQDTDVSEVVDLSAQVNQSGSLEWNFPAGTWEVLRIGYTDTAKELTDVQDAPKGLPLDSLSAEAFDHYWRDAVMPLLQAAKPYIGTSLRYLVTDSWEAGGANWTAGFREEFKRRRGYDPVPYLPVIAGRMVSSRETSNRFLFDLRRTVADLITENYYDRFAQRAAEQGLETHPESGGPHGAPIDALETFRSAAFPQTEFWAASKNHRVTDDERFFVKEAASAAHIYGKRLVAAEGLTSMNLAAWSESIGGNLQPAFDQALTEGLNRLFWHEFTSSPAEYGKPGQEYFAGTHLNPNVTWWEQSAPFLEALNRAQYLLQQGEPVSDLLYLYGDQVPAFVRVKSDDPAHVLPAYDYDAVNEDALLHRLQYAGADVHTPEGVHYRALALPVSRRLSYDALRWVERFVAQGGWVIGLKPSGPLSLRTPSELAEYARIANAMWAGCENAATESPYGQGRIVCTAEAHKAMQTLHVAPDFTYQLKDESRAQPASAFDFIHRQTDAADIYFVRNTTPLPVAATLSFRVSGRAPELWLPDDGTMMPALVYAETADHRTNLPLSFPPQGSIFIVFAKPAVSHFVKMEKAQREVFPSIRPGIGVYRRSDAKLVATEDGTYTATDAQGRKQTLTVAAAHLRAYAPIQWTLSFPQGWGAPASVPVDRFASWTSSDNPGIRYFSGTATYRGEFDIPATAADEGTELWLQLGEVREIATVLVNSHDAGSLWREPYAVRVDPFLRAGHNTIEIKVSNLWPNRLIGDLQPAALTKFTHTNVRAYREDSPLLPSGILQQVVLAPHVVLRAQP